PQCGYLRRDARGRIARAAVGERETVERLKLRRDAPALEEHRASSDLRRVRGEDGHDLYAAEKFERALQPYSSVAHTPERAAKRALLRCAVVDLGRASSSLSVIRLREVRQLEVDRESLREVISIRERHAADERLGLRHQRLLPVGVAVARGLALPGREVAQGLFRVEDADARLLLQDLAEQAPERAHVALQRRDLLLARVRGQLREPRALV